MDDLAVVPWKYGHSDVVDNELTKLHTFRSSISGEVIRIELEQDPTTGHTHDEVLWDSAVVLCDFFSKNHPIDADTVVFELGAGTGLTSILLARLGVKKIVATDMAVEMLRKNVVKSATESSISVAEFRWGDALPTTRIDLIILGDCFFGEYDLDALFRTLETRAINTRIILGYKERLAIEQKFFRKLFRGKQVVRHPIGEEFASTQVQIMEII